MFIHLFQDIVKTAFFETFVDYDEALFTKRNVFDPHRKRWRISLLLFQFFVNKLLHISIIIRNLKNPK